MAILGISAHKTTIYHTQSVQLINSNWLADPVKTVAMQSAVLGLNPTQGILDTIHNGAGFNLKMYYQYATKRFKKRNCLWNISTINTSGILNFGLNKTELENLIPNLKNKIYRIAVNNAYFSYSGAKLFDDINAKFGWNSFTKPLKDGTNIVVTGADKANTFLNYDGDLGNSWVIGVETSKNVPAVILDPTVDKSKIKGDFYLLAQVPFEPEKSAGIVYWLSSGGFKKTSSSTPIIEKYTEQAFKQLNIKEDTSLVQETNRITDWKDDKTFTVINVAENIPDKITKDDIVENIPIKSPEEHLTIYYQKYKGKSEIGKSSSGEPIYEYKVEVWEEKGTIIYDSEHYVWATQNSENIKGVGKYFQSKNTSNVTVKKYDNLFKFYPYLPTKEHGKNILDFSKVNKYVQALKSQAEHVSVNSTEVAPKQDRVGLKKEQRYKVKNDIPNETKKILLHKNIYTRKIKPNNTLGITKHDEHHLDKLGQLLNIDYKEASATIEANPDHDKIYHSSFLPAVTLGSNFDEVNEYWYTFFKRLHLKIGKSTQENFKNAVNKLPNDCTYHDTYSLPRTEITYGIANEGQFGGFISFAFIDRFVINGTIRTTKQKRRLVEVKAGMISEIYRLKGNSLKKELLEPSRELIKNDYYTSKASGKSYNIGGGKYLVSLAGKETNSVYNQTFKFDNIFKFKHHRSDLDDEISRLNSDALPIFQDKDKADLMFAKYNYTFFCKQLSNNKLDVIAVAGLIGGQSRSGYVIHNHESVDLDDMTIAARAIQDLNMFWERNKKRYVEKVQSDKIDVKVVFTAGSHRKKLETQIQTFFIVPLDYRTLIRMSGIDILRLADRATISINWVKVKVRTIRNWVKIFLHLVSAAITIVSTIYGLKGIEGKGASAIIKALVKSVAIGAVTQIAIKFTVETLIKLFGLKGLLAIIAVIVVAVLVMVLAGYTKMSSLPYASQTAEAQIASSAFKNTTETFVQSIMHDLQSLLKDMAKTTINNITNMSSKELLENSFGLISKISSEATKYIQKETVNIKEKIAKSEENYEKHMKELEELVESRKELTAPYDVKKVLGAIVNRAKLVDPSQYLQSALIADNTVASESYLANFIDYKLSLDPNTFDSVDSLDFSLKL